MVAVILMSALLFLAVVDGAPVHVQLPTMVVFNMSTLTTMNPKDENSFPSAFCVKGDLFSSVGELATVTADCGEDATRLDMLGAHVIPGLIDSHFHLEYGGFKLLRPSLEDCTSANGTAGPGQSIVELLQDYVAKRPVPAGSWLQGFGWDQNEWPIKNFPTRYQLDLAFPTIPVFLTRIDGHAAWANTAALKAVPPLPKGDPEGGTIQRDADGVPTGVFTDNAMQLVEAHIPAPTEIERRAALRLVLDDAAEHGLTGIHNPGVAPDSLELMKTLIDEGNFTLRQYAMYLGVSDDLGAAATPQTPKIENYKGQLEAKAVKFFMDGALGSWGAAMLQNYTDRPDQHGQLRMTEEEYNANVTAFAAAGFQIATHAIGDRANRIVLNKYRDVCEANGVPDLRLRIEHFQIVNVTDIPRLHVGSGPNAGSCILPSMQPTHATSDMVFAEDRLGPERLKGAYAWESALGTGLEALPLGSDFPTVGVVPPLLGLYAAITREDVHNNPPGGWTPSQKISPRQALAGYTSSAAYAAFHEDSRGMIKPGMFADFVAVDRNILDAKNGPTLWATLVLGTYLGGRPTFEHACYRGADGNANDRSRKQACPSGADPARRDAIINRSKKGVGECPH